MGPPLQKDMMPYLQKYMAHPFPKLAKELGSPPQKEMALLLQKDISHSFAFSDQLPIGGLRHFFRLCPFFLHTEQLSMFSCKGTIVQKSLVKEHPPRFTFSNFVDFPNYKQ